MNRDVKFAYSVLFMILLRQYISLLRNPSILQEDTLSARKVGSVGEDNGKTGSKMTTEATVKCPRLNSCGTIQEQIIRCSDLCMAVRKLK